MKRGTISSNALNNGDQFPITALDSVDNFLIAVNEGMDSVANAQLDSLEQVRVRA